MPLIPSGATTVQNSRPKSSSSVTKTKRLYPSRLSGWHQRRCHLMPQTQSESKGDLVVRKHQSQDRVTSRTINVSLFIGLHWRMCIPGLLPRLTCDVLALVQVVSRTPLLRTAATGGDAFTLAIIVFDVELGAILADASDLAGIPLGTA